MLGGTLSFFGPSILLSTIFRAFSKRYARVMHANFHKSQKRLFPTRIPVIAPITTQMNGEARRSCIILICPETCDRK